MKKYRIIENENGFFVQYYISIFGGLSGGWSALYLHDKSLFDKKISEYTNPFKSKKEAEDHISELKKKDEKSDRINKHSTIHNVD